MSALHKKSGVSNRHLRRRAKAYSGEIFNNLENNDFNMDEEIDFDRAIAIPDDTSSSDSCQDGDEIGSSEVAESQNLDQNFHFSSKNDSAPLIEEPAEEGLIYFRRDLLAGVEAESSSSDESDSDDYAASVTEKLRVWNLQYNITLSACKAILDIIRPLAPAVPHDPRTLNKTPRETPAQMLKNGAYIHVGLIEGFVKRLQHGTKDPTSCLVRFDVNVDGINMTKSTVTDVWPILCRSLDLKDSRPFVVGIFVGTGKPDPVERYVEPFVTETLQLMKDGLEVENRQVKFQIRCFICDAPARQYLKKIIGHAGYNGCERCHQGGEWLFNRMCYSRHVHEPRTDENFLRQAGDDHHTGVSPLLPLEIGMVSQFVLDPFHLVLEGVVKRFIRFVLKGNKKMRLSAHDIFNISERLYELRNYVPKEFVRRPRGLGELKDWKGVDLRFYLLYGGLISMKGIVNDTLCDIFSMLQVAMIIFSVNDLLSQESHFNFGKALIEEFVTVCSDKAVFEEKFCIYNVHSLLHLSEDVKVYGDISTISAFPFESYLGMLKKLLRSPTNPLQQLVRRLAERNYLYDFEERNMSITVSRPIQGSDHQFEIISFPTFMLSAKHKKDSFFKYGDSIASVVSIQKLAEESLVIVANVCDTKTDFFTYPCKSSIYGIFNLGQVTWTRKNVVVPASAVKTKYVVLPFKNDMVAIPMLHSF